MTARTAQLIGFTQGCEIRLTWNGSEVLHTTLPAMGTTDDLAVLVDWQTDTDVTGDIPMMIECLSGSLQFANIHMNMIRPVRENKVELVSIEDNFLQPVNRDDLSENDGKNSVTINGEPQQRHDTDEYAGAWQWLIQAGQTFSCTFQVDDFTQPPG